MIIMTEGEEEIVETIAVEATVIIAAEVAVEVTDAVAEAEEKMKVHDKIRR
jgi:hypothetical protein